MALRTLRLGFASLTAAAAVLAGCSGEPVAAHQRTVKAEAEMVDAEWIQAEARLLAAEVRGRADR